MVVGLALAGSFPVGALFYMAWSGCYQLVIINGITLRQKITSEPLLSRVNTTVHMIAWGRAHFGAAIGGGLGAYTDLRIAYLTMAGGVVLGAVLAWFSPCVTINRSRPGVPMTNDSQDQLNLIHPGQSFPGIIKANYLYFDLADQNNSKTWSG